MLEEMVYEALKAERQQLMSSAVYQARMQWADGQRRKRTLRERALALLGWRMPHDERAIQALGYQATQEREAALAEARLMVVS